ncbi:divalent-cation tolerance protein CutA [Methylobacillus gramineus]|uniref:divalent-cation tolerance protein CutA n=1 Tax=Methylobacillus gramineus TaxID=755169 RepID=UPI001CFFB2CD|nr:divalent-cation tolerance protein CutA [Methylobacillus gramineus]MCB5185684.1 divalent-cation tolerance protein CutA [Methylobacillus gramineus]
MKPQSPSSETTDTILVLTNLPDQNSAEKIAEHLIANQLAACVNLLAPCTSIYHWQGKIERAEEIPLLIKTTLQNYPAIEEAIQALHPYELPEIIHVPITGGLPAYLTWLHQETKA